jgi:methyl-accepting chemotaxis protein
MQIFKKLSLKSRFLLLGFSVFLGLISVTLPYVLYLKEKYAYYRLEAKGILYTQNLLVLLSAITEGKKKEAASLLQKVDELNRYVGKDLNIEKEWKKVKAQINHYLTTQTSPLEVSDVIAAITKLDFVIFEMSGAIADPDRAAINILIAHYLSLPQVLLHSLEKGEISSVLVSSFLEHYTYAINQKKELSFLEEIKAKVSPHSLSSLLALDKAGIKWVLNFTLKRKLHYKIYLIFTLLLTLFICSFIVSLLYFTGSTITKEAKVLNLLAERLEKAEFYAQDISLTEFKDELGIAIQKIARAIQFQGQMLEKIRNFSKALSKGQFEKIEEKEFKGLWKDTFHALNKTAQVINTLLRRIKSVAIGLRLGIPKRVDEKELEGTWREILIPLNNVAHRLEEVNSGISLTLHNISRGIFKVEMPASEKLKGIYKEIQDNLSEIVSSFKRVIAEIQRISSEIVKGNLEIKIEVSKFEGDYRTLMMLLEKIIEKMKEQVQQIKKLWQQEEELLSFKRTVEEDEHIETIYQRITNLLKNKFGLKQFVLYEVNQSKNFMSKIVSSENAEIFCNSNIFIDANFCRAKRRGQPVWGKENKWGEVCPMFNAKGKKYICYPFIFGEGVKLVLQIICENDKEYSEIKEKLESIRLYIESIVPLLEVKKLLTDIKRKENLNIKKTNV